ncbi:MAG: hypothetical protein B655_0984 [Methanobacterium sp. Maddingley MBC34]|nr:MAG: hypothetical protein B655_0984 [Methanobacterium sp. Maddingley MBC34]
MIRTYFESLKKQARSFQFLKDFKLFREFVDHNKGFIRFKMDLIDGSEVHVFEYVSGKLEKLDYSYHLQDKNKKLIVRWDNAPHHPGLENYPHHFHDGQNVKGVPKTTFHDILEELSQILENQ